MIEPESAKPTADSLRRNEQLGERLSVVFWCVLSLIPFGIVAIVVATLFPPRPEPVLVIMVPITLAVVGLGIACLYCARLNYRRMLWRRRHAVACARCGYDMAGLASETCPECGLEQARWIGWEEPVASSPARYPRLMGGLRVTASLGAAGVLLVFGGSVMRAAAFLILALWVVEFARQTFTRRKRRAHAPVASGPNGDDPSSRTPMR